MKRLSDEQMRILRHLKKCPWSCAKDMQTGIRTLIALNRKGLIYVETTFSSIAYPQGAHAWLTLQGELALSRKRS